MSNQQTDLFWELLANPADRSYSHVQNLRQLVNEYPQSSLLQSLLFYTGEDDRLSHAAVYTDPRLLYKLRHDAGSLSQVSDDQLIKVVKESNVQVDDIVHGAEPEPEIPSAVSDNESEREPLFDQSQPTEHFEPQVSAEDTPEAVESEIIVEPEKLDDLINYGDEVTTGEHELQPPVTEFHHPEQEAETPAAQENIPLPEHTLTSHEEEQPVADTPATEPELPTLGFYVPGAANADENSYSGGDISTRLYETYAETFEHTPQPEPHPIEDEVFDEIVGIDDINIASSVPFAVADEEGSQPALGFEVPSEASKEDAAKSRRVDLNDEAEKLMLSNIAATDFFVFDHALSERIKAGDDVRETPLSSPAAQAESAPISAPQNTAPATGQPATEKHEYERVTKYFDEKMPYSFMWWLDKTRKEHSGIYQPFVLDTTRNIEKNIPDELQQQYYENIFHLTSVEDLERATGSEPVVFDTRKKEDEIIERFIHEAPQIKPQTSEKLDNENKAKRSSEDQDEIVTETLAQIYTDQMLYHKAIRVYQKLMLKFPEKSLYFAGQIEQLEKKIS